MKDLVFNVLVILATVATSTAFIFQKGEGQIDPNAHTQQIDDEGQVQDGHMNS